MSNIDTMSVNAIRALAADAVQKANSGHPGLPLGSAAMAYELWAKHMNHNPAVSVTGQTATVLFCREAMGPRCCIRCFICLDMGIFPLMTLRSSVRTDH